MKSNYLPIKRNIYISMSIYIYICIIIKKLLCRLLQKDVISV